HSVFRAAAPALRPRRGRGRAESWCRRYRPPKRQPWSVPPWSAALNLELIRQCDLFSAANIDRHALVDTGGNEIEHAPASGGSGAAGLLGQHRERRDFVHQAQLALALATGA